MSKLLEKAIIFATEAHKGQKRRLVETDYIVHPYAVAVMLMEAGYGEDVVVGGMLHDIVEDTKYTLEEVENTFGSEIARLVCGVSEEDKSLPWKVRKEGAIEEIKNAEDKVKAIACADKINNIEGIYEGLQCIGDSIWNEFHAGKDEVEWYYRSMRQSLATGDVNRNLLDRLDTTIELVFGEK